MHQQPILNNNIGRFATMIRWCMEYQISVIFKRYATFHTPIPQYFVPYIGISLRLVINFIYVQY